MTRTEKFEGPLAEASMHPEGRQGYIADKLGKIAGVELEIAHIHTQIRGLNNILGDLQGVRYQLYCEVKRVEEDGQYGQS